MRRTVTVSLIAAGLVAAVAAPALACAGLVAPNGSVRLTRTATLAGYHDGVEHYVTSFEFKGGGAKFGSIVPLPDVPSKVTRGGKWTLQRLQRETQPPQAVPDSGGPPSAPAPKPAEELYETEIDGLLITILKGGSRAVGKWAKKEGFALTPDAPEVLRFYAQRSKIFMAARFIPEKARDEEKLQEGDGVPIHLRIPTDNPWVPLRVLALGKRPYQDVNADVYLLTDDEPALLPAPVQAGSNRGMVLERSEEASDLLLDDLRSDKGMKWIPEEMWLTYLRIEMNARNLVYDLAVDASGSGAPSEEDAYGVQEEEEQSETAGDDAYLLSWIVVPIAGVGAVRALRSRRRG
ncbi:MAG TPA: DUF2330 domain-containing protein [Actinomycetota bacterium]|nr:DUF2330 domain-containing protein [Actinomycetota bacterium]